MRGRYVNLTDSVFNALSSGLTSARGQNYRVGHEIYTNSHGIYLVQSSFTRKLTSVPLNRP